MKVDAMDLEAQIKQLNKVNDKRDKKIAGLRMGNEELHTNQNNIKEQVKVDVTNQTNMWRE